MPVTAKLSRRFYEVLGEDVANELVNWFNQVDTTYRADLRELNELNFARFDARMEHRLSTLRADLSTRLEIGLANGDAKMEKLKSELLRWMFGMWITLIGTMIALERLGR